MEADTLSAVSEVHERYGRVADGFGARLSGVGKDQWTAQTPCTDWDVRELVVHVITTHRRVVASASKTDPVPVDPGGDLFAQWRLATEAVADRLRDPEQSSMMVSGMFGEQTFELLVSRLLCSDTLFHTWDLARATGQSEALDAGAVVMALAFLEPLDEAIRRPGGFAPKITPLPGADDQARLLNFGGRSVQ